MNTSFVKFTFSNVRNKFAEKIYINWGIELTRPIQIYGIINDTCNAHCPMCGRWRRSQLRELPASDWIRTLKSIKKTAGTFHINFSGGEPLLKKDFFEILEFCTKEKIMAGFTTNGLLLNKKNIDKILNLKIANINISVDSMDNKIHDTMRGMPGLLDKVKKNIEYLVSEKNRLKNKVQILLKPTVGSFNMDGLGDIVLFAKDLKLTGVNFQPIYKWTAEAEMMFKVDHKKLCDTIDKLVEMKKKGFNILNTIESIRDWRLHFEEVIPKQNSPCLVALRNLTISPDGDIYLCALGKPKIGNIMVDDIGLLWKSDMTKKYRKAQVNCKQVCTETCVVKRSWKDYANVFFKFLRG
jgi:radical SAM protein with 4Fe4S-binding SPASM domain